jgi:ribosome-associated translation inhibitor RaiA
MPRTFTHFVHVDRSAHLDRFVQKKIADLVSSFKKGGRYHLDIWISKIRSKSGRRGPLFRCEVCLKLDEDVSGITVKKKSDNFYTAIEEAGLSLRGVLTRRSRCKARHGHRQGDQLIGLMGVEISEKLDPELR